MLKQCCCAGKIFAEESDELLMALLQFSVKSFFWLTKDFNEFSHMYDELDNLFKKTKRKVPNNGL